MTYFPRPNVLTIFSEGFQRSLETLVCALDTEKVGIFTAEAMTCVELLVSNVFASTIS